VKKEMTPKSFKTSFRVAWADTDAAQVVHYSNYFRFFERAEEEFYRHLGFTFTDAQERGLWFPRIEAFCQYKKPARFNDLIEVELTVEELREKSVKYGFKIFNKESNTLLANGYVVIVAADQKMGKAAPIPKDMVEKLQPFCKQGF
jgi:acyl-CoA thioester hydrolase